MELFPVYSIQNVVVDRAEGAEVWDVEGRRYLDFYGGHAVISIGHGHPHWVDRIQKQIKKISFYSNSVILPIQRELAHTLGRVCGRPEYQLFLCNSGAEANENALKLASFHTGRRKIIAFKKAFHGRTSLAVSVTDNPALSAPVNQTDCVEFLPFNDVSALHEVFQRAGNEIAAVIVEGIQGVGGIHVATAEFLSAIRELCDAHSAVYIADAVQCGYGRIGRFFAHDFGPAADLYSVAKGMGNGFPVAGVLIHPKFQAKVGMLGTTFGGNPLACAAALAVLEVIESENLIARAADVGQRLMQELTKISAQYPAVKNVRGRGLMIGFDVGPGDGKQAQAFRQQLLQKHGIFTGEAKPNTVRLLPMLNLPQSAVDEFLSAVVQTLSEVRV